VRPTSNALRVTQEPAPPGPPIPVGAGSSTFREIFRAPYGKRSWLSVFNLMTHRFYDSILGPHADREGINITTSLNIVHHCDRQSYWSTLE
jgi:hypothetical protein